MAKKEIMMMFKKIVFFIITLFCCFTINAQKESNLKLVVEGGFLHLYDTERTGLFANLEPKLKVSENIFIGLRSGVTVNSHIIDNDDIFQFNINTEADNGVISFVPTIDYYMSIQQFRPYFGFGLGVYLLADYIDASRVVPMNSSQNDFELYVNNQIGLLLRGGVEIRKFKFGFEYNLVSKAGIEIPNEAIIGTIDNSYFGLSIGFVFGNGKSKN